MTGDQNAADTLRMAAAELDALIAEMNRAGDDFAGDSRRKMRRWPYTGMRIAIELVEHNGHRRRILAAPRDLSAGGMCILHGGFIHPGVTCVVHLTQLSGTRNAISGRVARCRHVRGRLHESGVSFASPVRPEDYVSFGEGAVFHIERVDPQSLEGPVLVAASNASEQRLFAHHLRDTKLNLIFATDHTTCLEGLAKSPRVAFIDQVVGDKEGIDLLRELREAGMTCPAALMTTRHDPAYREDAMSRGATEVLSKPFTRELLLRAMAEFMQRGDALGGGHSRAANGASAREVGLPLTMLEEFVAEMRRLALQIDEQVSRNDAGALKRTLGQLQSSASGHGFLVVAQSAEQTAERLSAASGAKQLDPSDAQELINLCRTARAFP